MVIFQCLIEYQGQHQSSDYTMIPYFCPLHSEILCQQIDQAAYILLDRLLLFFVLSSQLS